MKNSQLILKMKESGVLKSESIADAFIYVDRKNFILPSYENQAYEDIPLPIGYGQTISQPSTVAFMLEILQIRQGDHVLDVGSGSGWTTALLAHIAGQSGRVFATEIIPELVLFGRENIERLSFSHAEIRQAGTILGLPEHAPYDRILVSASSNAIPLQLVEQLKIGGIMVIPVGNSIMQIQKVNEDLFLEKEYKGFVFVPLVE